ASPGETESDHGSRLLGLSANPLADFIDETALPDTSRPNCWPCELPAWFEGHTYANIRMVLESIMKRTTVFADEDILRKLREVAKRENSTVAEVTRKALSEYVSRRRSKRSRLSLIAIGRSGRKDVAERAEELLRKGFGR